MAGSTTDPTAFISWYPKSGRFVVKIINGKKKVLNFKNEKELIEGLWEQSPKFFKHGKKSEGLCPHTTQWVRPNPRDPKYFGNLELPYDIPPQEEAPERRFLHRCPPLVYGSGERDITEYGLKTLSECNARLKQTKDYNVIKTTTTDEKGCKIDVVEYTPERKELHNEIIGWIKAQNECIASVEGKPIAILTGGPPASGKTRYMSKLRKWTDPKVTGRSIFRIDADQIRAMLPEYEGWNANSTHEETRDILFNLLESIGTPCKTDVIYDGTMSSEKKYIALVEKLKQLGYEVFIVYMNVPPDVSQNRVLGRYVNSGRFVPLDVVMDVNTNSYSTFEKLRGIVDGWMLVDGTGKEPTKEGGKPLPFRRPYYDMPEQEAEE